MTSSIFVQSLVAEAADIIEKVGELRQEVVGLHRRLASALALAETPEEIRGHEAWGMESLRKIAEEEQALERALTRLESRLKDGERFNG